MTEQEWQECSDPQEMLAFLRGKVSDRKLRMFAVACCRMVWKWLTDRRSRVAVRVAEQYADKKATKKRLREVRKAARQAVLGLNPKVAYYRHRALHAALNAVEEPIQSLTEASENASGAILCHPHTPADRPKKYGLAKKEQSSLLRDMFGPLPFRPVSLNPGWLTSTVKQLAETIYEKRVFDRLPFLADALEEAGCDNADILNHLRGPGPHTRGCWCLDLILRKE